MENVARVGIDLAKEVFHVTAVDGVGAVVERRRLRRAGLESYLTELARGCEVAMESCGGAHHWARRALEAGLRPLLMSPQFVKPYVKSNKNDVADADAIAEASGRPAMRFVAAKSVEQEHIQQVHRARQLAVKAVTSQSNQIRGFLLEYGVALRRGAGAVLRGLPEVLEDATNELPDGGRALLHGLGEELRRQLARVRQFDREIEALAQRSKAARLLQTIPGIGALTATALVAAVGDGSQFRNGREMAAWLGLVPRQHTTGGRPRLLGISKRGDRYLRTLLIHGGRAVLQRAARHEDRRSRWALGVAGRRNRNVAAVALANKNARTAWAMLRHARDYDAEHRGAAGAGKAS